MTGKQIKSLRERLKWSQDKLAEYLGYRDRGAVSNVEGEKKGVSGPVLKLLQLLRLYGKDAARLWDKRYRKQVKDVIKGEPDEDNN